jgi:hypothetical protein
MIAHVIVWIIQIILLIILALILLTPRDQDIKDYFDKQGKDDER